MQPGARSHWLQSEPRRGEGDPISNREILEKVRTLANKKTQPRRAGPGARGGRVYCRSSSSVRPSRPCPLPAMVCMANENTFGSNGSTTARIHATSGEPKTSMRVKFWTRGGATQVKETTVQVAPVVVLNIVVGVTIPLRFGTTQVVEGVVQVKPVVVKNIVVGVTAPPIGGPICPG